MEENVYEVTLDSDQMLSMHKLLKENIATQDKIYKVISKIGLPPQLGVGASEILDKLKKDTELKSDLVLVFQSVIQDLPVEQQEDYKMYCEVFDHIQNHESQSLDKQLDKLHEEMSNDTGSTYEEDDDEYF